MSKEIKQLERLEDNESESRKISDFRFFQRKLHPWPPFLISVQQRIIKCKLKGFWWKDTMLHFARELNRAIDYLTLSKIPFYLIVDITEFEIQAFCIQQCLLALTRYAVYRGLTGKVNIVDSNTSKSRLRKFALIIRNRTQDFRFFKTEERALKFLNKLAKENTPQNIDDS